MALIDEQRHRMIRQAVLRHPDRVGDASAALWRSLALHLCAIIGNHGFTLLYERSVHQLAASQPWLANQPPPLGEPAFAELQRRLQQQDSATAGEASVALLTTFLETLTLLIGELVTASILRAAWGDDTINHDAGTEFKA
jgi:hypothetical protein